jgi:hypothetical protein
VAWTTPRTWVASETVTTVMMNTHIRDNLLALLTIPLCKMTKAATQSIPNTLADTLITLDQSLYDTDTMANTANNRIDIKTAGKYLFGSGILWATDTTGFRLTRIKHTRSSTQTIISEVRGVTGSASNQVSRVTTTIWDCQVGDFVQLYVANNASAALNVMATPIWSPTLYCFRVAT